MPATDATFTIAPGSLSRAAAQSQMRRGACQSTASTCSFVSRRGDTPAAFTTKSSGPSQAASSTPSAASSARSTDTGVNRYEGPSSWSATSRPITWHPARTSCVVTARPIPDAEPVTSARFPAKNHSSAMRCNLNPMHDAVIRNGAVADGTGGPLQSADIAIDDGAISIVGEVSDRGRDEIDARDLVVAPGWVDIHTHYDGQVSWDTLIAPSSWHGVTTAVMGNCGVGFAPVMPDKHDWLIELMEGVEDIPGTALHEGISWDWESFPEYLDAVERSTYALDIGAQVPHTAVRGFVMGDRGGDRTEVPTAEEIARMGELAADGIRAGALGFSTSRTVAHRSKSGAYTPSLTATRDELLGIAAAIGETRLGVFEIVADLDDLDGEMALIRAMAEVSGRPLSLTVLQRPTQGDMYRRILELISRAEADGVPLYGQVAARPVGLIMRLDSRMNPFAASPTYQKLAGLSQAEIAAKLREPELRDRVLVEVDAARERSPLTIFSDAYAMGSPFKYDPDPSTSVQAIAAQTGRSAFEVALEALARDEGRGALYFPVMNYRDGNLDATREML